MDDRRAASKIVHSDSLRHYAPAVHHIRSLHARARHFHHRAADDGGVDIVRARPAFRLLHPLPIPVKPVAPRRPAIDTLQPIRPVPLIGSRAHCRHIDRIIDRRASVVI